MILFVQNKLDQEPRRAMKIQRFDVFRQHFERSDFKSKAKKLIFSSERSGAFFLSPIMPSVKINAHPHADVQLWHCNAVYLLT